MKIRDLPDKKPPLSEGLIKFLEETYPDTIPRQELTPFEMGKLVGQRDVVEHLKSLYEQEDNYVYG
jgi:hypothetical protein